MLRSLGRIVPAIVGLSLSVLPLAVAATPYVWKLPEGFPRPKVPADNPMSVEKVELGRFLFYDKRLSGNLTQSCASCHQQALGFADGRAVALGSTGESHPRNSMGLTNIAYAPTLTWASPLLRELERQARNPMFGETPVELGLAGLEDELLLRLAADMRYRRLFAEAFGEDPQRISVANVTRAIASFQRTLISGDSPYDRYLNGRDDNALSAAAVRGAQLFFSERLECFHCHGGFNFTGSVSFEGQALEEVLFENTGLYNIDGRGAYPAPNRGLFEITAQPADMGRFKPPTLRNIELTAPYMHDGSIATLEEALDHYAAGGRTIAGGPYAGDGSANPYRSLFMVGFRLSAQEKENVLAFLHGLTDPGFVTDPRFADPFVAPVCSGDCDSDGSVTVDELVKGVGVALGDSTLATCVGFDASGDGDVDVAEIVAAVGRALGGCARPARGVAGGG